MLMEKVVYKYTMREKCIHTSNTFAVCPRYPWVCNSDLKPGPEASIINHSSLQKCLYHGIYEHSPDGIHFVLALDMSKNVILASLSWA
jgi:hypothetical protein